MTEPTTTVAVNVSQKDIKLGKKGECSGCPVAIAVKRQLGLLDCYVGSPDIDLVPRNGRWFSTAMPTVVSRFVMLFDRREPVSPFTFTLEVPTRFVRKSGVPA